MYIAATELTLQGTHSENTESVFEHPFIEDHQKVLSFHYVACINNNTIMIP